MEKATKAINKSDIMKEAWMIYRHENTRWRSLEFKWCLRRAWAHAKGELKIYHESAIYKAHLAAGDYAYKAKYEAIMQAHRDAWAAVRVVKAEPMSESFYKGLADYYDNAPKGTYFGD